MKCLATVIVAAALTTTPVSADIARGFDDEMEITDIYTDLDSWLEDAPDVVTIDFGEFPEGTEIDDDYAELGVEFTSGFYTIQTASAFTDGFGLDGNNQFIAMEFNQPMNVVAVLFPGRLRYEFYLDGEPVGWTETFGGGGTGFFAGVLADVAFNQVLVLNEGEANLDNLYFSFEPIPAPGAVALLGIAALAGCTRRRRARET